MRTRCPHQLPEARRSGREGSRLSQKYVRQMAHAGREITSTSSRTPSEPQIFAHTYTLMSKQCKSGKRGSLGSIRAATMTTGGETSPEWATPSHEIGNTKKPKPGISREPTDIFSV